MDNTVIDYDKVLSQRIKNIKPSGIRKYFDIAESMEGVISLGVGEPDFKTPWVARREAVRVLEKGKTTYTANAGLMTLREECAKYFRRTIGVNYDPASEVVITVGGSEGIDLTIRSMISDGDEVLIVEPCFVCYDPIVSLCGGVPVAIETKAEDDFRLTAEELREKITERTKLLVLPYPNNPTGAIMKKEDLEEIAKVLRGTDIMVLSDEIYSELTYSGEHVSISSLEGMRERTVVINGFSKAFAMTGWRLGIAAGPKEVISQMLKLHQYAIMSSPTVSQYAAITALRECGDDVRKMREEYDMRRRYIVDAFNKLGLSCFTPMGAFYVFPCIKSTGLTSGEFCEKLVYSKKVAVVPGSAFGKCGEGFIRVSYAYSLSHLMEAVKRIGEFLKELDNDR
ncbi:MAG: aminotransferase class I/II-fold pyridoxal phosphate-dependent enzyme [Ruminococcus sp.]|nr:aminotransferase class I/II-fold pyridoxal phosphate-dependent enzyme [Ruminococcus sp.]